MTDLTLYLLRHGKSSWGNGDLADIDRPLADRGHRGADAAGAHLAAQAMLPDRILCSVARRARETLAGLVPHIDRDTDIHLIRRIYDADADDLLDLVNAQVGVASLMLIGHNPAFEELAHMLAGSGEADALTRMKGKFPTSCLATFRFRASDWSAVGAGKGRLAAFWVPEAS